MPYHLSARLRRTSCLTIAICLFAFSFSPAYASHTIAPTHPHTSNAATASSARPRIALALSGGGARGAAHIGVLKVLESLHVPIDCITGTSMGSIVGGLYASGTDIVSLERTINDTDWDAVFNDLPPRTEISIRRKQDDQKGLATPEFGIHDGQISVPKGLITGISIQSYLYRLTRNATGINDFDNLPIPFRAVAADIETGDAIILEKGSLAQALRASMSIPGVMAPVEIEGRLLVDGGIANNLPIEPARKLCGDVIIAINIQTPLLEREQITSAVSISAQLIRLLGKANVDREISSLDPDHDILITPDLGDISSSSFDRQQEAIAIGEAAALAMKDSLQRYSISPESYAAHRATQTTLIQTAEKPLESIQLEGLKRTNQAVLTDLIHTQPGDIPNDEKIAADIRRLYGRGDFESIDYRILNTPQRTLLIDLQEKSWGPDYLRFGLGLAADSSGESSFALAANYRRSWLNRLGREWVTEARIGNNSALSTELYQPFDETGRFFYSTYGMIENSRQDIFDDDNRIAIYRSLEYRLGADLGINLGTTAMLRFGPMWRSIHLERDTGATLYPDNYTQRIKGLRAQFYLDQMDRAWLPQNGYLLDLSAMRSREKNSGDSDYTHVEGSGYLAFSHKEHTLNFALSGGANIGDNIPLVESFALGGPLKLSSYQQGELRGNRYVFARATYYNHTIRFPSILGTGIYLGASVEAGHVSDAISIKRDNTGLRVSTSLFLAADTALGPAYLGIATGDNNQVRLYFMLGIQP